MELPSFPFEVGDRLELRQGRGLEWTVRAHTRERRYYLATAINDEGIIHYTILEPSNGVRGALGTIEYGLDIHTVAGPDERINEAISMLEVGWGISHENRVPLAVLAHTRPSEEKHFPRHRH